MDQRRSSSPPWEQKQRRPAGTGLERGFRIGYVAKGILYLSIGGLLAVAPVRAAGRAPAEDAVAAVVASPLGAALLLLAAFGAAAYTAWQLICATVDRVPRTTIADLWVRRMAYAASGGFHIAIALVSAELLARGGAAPRGSDWLPRLLSWGPGGELAVGTFGAALPAFSAREILRANVHHDTDRLDLRDMRAWLRPLVRGLGTFGRTARGVLLALLAMSLIFAASHQGSEQTLDLNGAISTIHAWAAGCFVLGAAARGLVAYGLFELIESGHRVVKW